MKTLLALPKDVCGGLRAALVAVLILLSCSGAVAWAELKYESIQSLRAQAEQGDADAQYHLGRLYRVGKLYVGGRNVFGEGVPQNYAEAAKWFRRAAQQGHNDAKFVLALIYSLGRGVPQDNAESMKWLRNAAEHGHARAQSMLGLSYESGQKVPQDYREAYIWFSVAAANGQKDAGELRDKAAENLSPADLSAAQAEATRRHAEIQRRVENMNAADSPLRQEADTPQNSGGCGNEIDALTFAQLAVERKLKSPSDADFPWPGGGNEVITEIGECEYSVKSYVDAPNSFGATVRTHFVVRLRFDKAKDAWIIRDVRFSE